MSFVRQLAGRGAPERQAQDYTGPVDLQPWLEAFAGGRAKSGRLVTVEQALGLTAIWRALSIFSETVGSLPLHTYIRRQGGGKTKAFFEDVYDLLHLAPNRDMTAFTCWSLVAAHLKTWGNAFLGKEFENGRVVQLWPIRPDRVRIARQGGQKRFYVRDSRGVENSEPYSAAEIIHIPGLGLDGLRGISPVQNALESIGGGLALDEFANRFFANNAVPPAVAQMKGTLDDEAKKRFKAEWNSMHRGAKNAHRIAVLEGETEIKQLQMTLRESQLVELRKFFVQEAARIIGVPASMIEGEKGGSLQYSTVELDNLWFATHSVRPSLVQIEQSLARDPDLFPERKPLFAEFSLEGLLRADAKTRAEYYAVALDPVKGWMKRTEARDLENLPPDASFDLPPAASPAPAEGQQREVIVLPLPQANGNGNGHARESRALVESVVGATEALQEALTREQPAPIVHVQAGDVHVNPELHAELSVPARQVVVRREDGTTSTYSEEEA